MGELPGPAGAHEARPRLVKSSQELCAGLFLIAVACFALWQTAPLESGSLRAFGPGMAPKALAALTGGLGVIVAASAFLAPGKSLEAWSLRGPLCVLGAVMLFAETIRGLGLAVAGPLAVTVGSFASKDARPLEALIFGILLTGACILLFKTLLGLPIPVATFW